jgi:hypothetical protein
MHSTAEVPVIKVGENKAGNCVAERISTCSNSTKATFL